MQAITRRPGWRQLWACCTYEPHRLVLAGELGFELTHAGLGGAQLLQHCHARQLLAVELAAADAGASG